jgi:hypothetical protein
MVQQLLRLSGNAEVNGIAVGRIDGPIDQVQAILIELPRLLDTQVEETAETPEKVHL